MAKASKPPGNRSKKKPGVIKNKNATAAPLAVQPGRPVAADITVRLFTITDQGETKKAATVTITPVNDVHLIETDVNAVALATDTDILKDQVFTRTENISPVRPLSFYINITGTANTMITVKLELGAVTEYKGDIYIPDSGRLTVQKIIA